MDNNIKFTIDFEVLGAKEVDRAPQSLKAVASAVADISGLLAPLSKIVELLEGITGKLDTFGKVAGEGFEVLGKKVEEVDQKIDQLQKDAAKKGGEVKKSLFDQLGDTAFRFNNIKQAAEDIVGKIAPIFEEGMARQNAEVQFSTLLGSEEEGKAYAAKLRNSTMATLYGNGTVNDAAKNMLAFGLDTQTISPILESIGDIAAGDAQKFGSLSLAFAQISSAGKLGGQDLMQLINAGFNPLQDMAERTGKTIGQLKDEMAKGAISAKDVEEAFLHATSSEGKFYDMSNKIKNETLGGQLAVMQASVDDLKAKVFDALLPVVQKLTPIITEQILPAVMDLIEKIVPLGEWIADNIDIVGILAGTILGLVSVLEIWSGVQTVLNAIMTANPISLIIVGVAALVALIAILVKRYEEWGAAVSLLLGPIGFLINIVMTIKRYWDDIVETFQSDGILAGIERIGVALYDIVLYPVQQLVELLADLTGADWAKSAAESVANFRQGLGTIDPEKKAEETKEEGTGINDALASAISGGEGADLGDLQNLTNKGTEAVSSGGTRNTSINITLGNMVENINFQGGVQENSESLTAQLQDVFVRVLATATTTL